MNGNEKNIHELSLSTPQIFIIATLQSTRALVHLGGCLCIQYVYVALLRNFTEINFTK